MSLFFLEERNKDFLNACVELHNKHRQLSVSQIAKMAINTPAPSFYLTTKGYIRIIYLLKKGKIETQWSAKKELYAEIKKKIESIPNYKEISGYELSRLIDSCGAPKFYISEGRAINLYYNLIKENNKANALRHRNDFYARNFVFR
jgi:hypothetical protein